MNNIDIENIKKELAKHKAANYEWKDGGEMTKDDVMLRTTKELNTLLKDYEHSEEDKYSKELKNLVDEMFNKYGKEGDNMIAVWDANVFERYISAGDDPLKEIYWKGFVNKYNKLYYPICANDKKVPNEYYKDIEKLEDILRNLKIKDAYDYWKDDNDALNECWYGVIGIMKDYRVVAFVIRNDGMLCDEDGYDTFHNKIVKSFN